MERVTRKNDKFKQAIIISVILHAILFVPLICSSFDAYVKVLTSGKDSSIHAVMVEPSLVVQNYNHQEQQYSSAKRVEKQHARQVQQQEVEIKKYPKQPKKDTEDVKKFDTRTKKMSGSEKKETQEMKKKSAAEEVEPFSNIDNLFDDLISEKDLQKSTPNRVKDNLGPSIGSGDTKDKEVSNRDISNYAGKIKSAIESRFYDSSSYTGKICTLRIKLAPNGILLDIKSERGDPALCNAALSAARQANMPKPPSRAVYEFFKNVPLDFKP